MKQITYFLLLFLLIVISPGLFADSISLYFENDFAFNDDSDYSNGLRVEYKFSDYSIFLAQSIYTPDNIKNDYYVEGSHPYGGFLGIGGSLYKRTPLADKNKLWTNYLEIMLGVVGPSSHAEEVQSTIHKIIGAHQPNGWDNQLHDEFEIQASYWTGSEKTILTKCNGALNIALIDEIGGMFGTMYDCVGINSGIRISYGTRYDYSRIGQLEIRSATITTNDKKLTKFKDDFYGHIFLGNETRWWLWNVFLDGNRDGDSYSVEKESFTTALKFGTGIGYKKIFFSTIVLFCTKEYSTQTETPNYINFQLTYTF